MLDGFFFFKQKTAYEIGVTGVQTCALPIFGEDVAVYAWVLPLWMVVSLAAGPLFGVAVGQAGFTVLVALLFAQVDPVTWRLAEVRLEDVLVGGVVGILMGADRKSVV